jgi:hypothetical protein
MARSKESAAELVARMLTSYAVASSYADRGTASSLVGRLRINFETTFVRGQQFRFVYRKENDRNVLWSDGVHTYSHRPNARLIGHPDMFDDGPDIALALGAIAGTSSGISTTVPAMLLPVSVGHSNVAHLGELSFERDELVGSHTCAVITGRSPSAELATLWIDRETYLLRHLITARGLWHETTTSYEPSLDPIDVRTIARPPVETIAPQARVRRWTGIHIEHDTRRVESIDDGSPAARSGLVIGDEVEVVNGQRTENFFDVLKALHVVDVGVQLALTVRRDKDAREILVQVEAASEVAKPVPSRPLVE